MALQVNQENFISWLLNNLSFLSQGDCSLVGDTVHSTQYSSPILGRNGNCLADRRSALDLLMAAFNPMAGGRFIALYALGEQSAAVETDANGRWTLVVKCL